MKAPGIKLNFKIHEQKQVRNKNDGERGKKMSKKTELDKCREEGIRRGTEGYKVRQRSGLYVWEKW